MVDKGIVAEVEDQRDKWLREIRQIPLDELVDRRNAYRVVLRFADGYTAEGVVFMWGRTHCHS